MHTYILGIESSCDDTAAAILDKETLLSNVTAGQDVHQAFGGVVPELASRAHQQHIIPVIDSAIRQAKIGKNQIAAVAYTQGPGLLGSLLVGASFAKSFALSLGIPLIEVDHMQAHILAHFVRFPGLPYNPPGFPFICLTVSGGHTQLVMVREYFDMEVLGSTIDDAAGETFDKAAKIMGLPYPGGPVIDKLAQQGDSRRFTFSRPQVSGLNFSFSGLKTSFLYLIRDELKKDPDFIEKNRTDLAASIQATIIEILTGKLRETLRIVNQKNNLSVNHIAIAGGVSANSGLREALLSLGREENVEVHIPPFSLTTDNAAMIGITGFFKYNEGRFASQGGTPYARSRW